MLGICIKASLIIDTSIYQKISCTRILRLFPSPAAAPGIKGTTLACRFLTICCIIFFPLRLFSSSFSLFNKMSKVRRSSYAFPRQHGLSLRGEKRDRVVRIIFNIVKICEAQLALYVYILVCLGLFMEILSSPSGLTNYFINNYLFNSLH